MTTESNSDQLKGVVPAGTSIKKARSSRLLSAAALAFDALASSLRRRTKAHILIACMPKSGSTFLATAMAAHNGFRRVRLVPAWGSREQELCQIRLSRYNHAPYVAQHHVRNSEWTQQLITTYGMTPIVLVRDLCDVVVSFRDHLRKESRVFSMAYFTEDHLRLEDAALEEAIIRLAMPWYLNFYAGWRADPNAMIVFYEDLLANPIKTVASVFERANVNTNVDQIALALQRCEKGQTRFNVGITGRGCSLAREASAAMLRLLDCYPEFNGDELFKRTRNTATTNATAEAIQHRSN